MAAAAFTLELEATSDGAPSCRLRGQVTLADGAALWRELSAVLSASPCLQLDLAEVDRLDGGAAALLQALAMQQAANGGRLDFVAARGEAARMLQLYACRDATVCARAIPAKPGMLADIGNFALAAGDHTRAILSFTGDLVLGLWRALRKPKTVHTADLGRLVEQAGADGLPIIGLMQFLVGGVLGLQGAMQLHRFGGDSFLASLVGLSTVREFGPLLTAILVAGRSGAGYAAELGTMTVNEEIDALRTLGQDPQRFLVFPRVLTLLLVVPVLTMVANVAGILGGLVIAVVYLEQPVVVYLQMLQRYVDFGDVGTGLLKSVAFAAAIGLIACQRGLATRGGASGVGQATTSAVVTSLFSLVVLDAVFTNLFSLVGW